MKENKILVIDDVGYFRKFFAPVKILKTCPNCKKSDVCLIWLEKRTQTARCKVWEAK